VDRGVEEDGFEGVERDELEFGGAQSSATVGEALDAVEGCLDVRLFEIFGEFADGHVGSVGDVGKGQRWVEDELDGVGVGWAGVEHHGSS
jgi:hypothetical protein